jgi:hypothetical protein
VPAGPLHHNSRLDFGEIAAIEDWTYSKVRRENAWPRSCASPGRFDGAPGIWWAVAGESSHVTRNQFRGIVRPAGTALLHLRPGDPDFGI